ncbi:multi-sensor signal transduction histidine kinase [Thauera phenylacetica B4P]|uniref:Multi-sensor signal transduction histidine kinase n=1 Tax=Thauera phenylacetica B4P TaxID=1234382 RepID=N6YUK1_9RHOO|nr:multi-sensor signal transduction histidine kinase [Thauera phenylacetica B4P]
MIGTVHDVSAQRAAAEALRTANARLRQMSLRVLDAQEAERRAVAYELHDQIGQALTAVKLDLQAMTPHLDAGPAVARLAAAIHTTEEALAQVRGLSLNLRPPQLDYMGLEASLRWHAERECARAGLALEFDGGLGEFKAEERCAIVCFRLLQEALTNVVRHAGAKRVRIALAAADGRVDLEIADDGRGFDLARAPAHARRRQRGPARHGGARGADRRRGAHRRRARRGHPHPGKPALYRAHHTGVGFGHGRNASSAGGRSQPGARGHSRAARLDRGRGRHRGGEQRPPGGRAGGDDAARPGADGHRDGRHGRPRRHARDLRGASAHQGGDPVDARHRRLLRAGAALRRARLPAQGRRGGRARDGDRGGDARRRLPEPCGVAPPGGQHARARPRGRARGERADSAPDRDPRAHRQRPRHQGDRPPARPQRQDRGGAPRPDHGAPGRARHRQPAAGGRAPRPHHARQALHPPRRASVIHGIVVAPRRPIMAAWTGVPECDSGRTPLRKDKHGREHRSADRRGQRIRCRAGGAPARARRLHGGDRAPGRSRRGVPGRPRGLRVVGGAVRLRPARLQPRGGARPGAGERARPALRGRLGLAERRGGQPPDGARRSRLRAQARSRAPRPRALAQPGRGPGPAGPPRRRGRPARPRCPPAHLERGGRRPARGHRGDQPRRRHPRLQPGLRAHHRLRPRRGPGAEPARPQVRPPRRGLLRGAVGRAGDPRILDRRGVEPAQERRDLPRAPGLACGARRRRPALALRGHVQRHQPREAGPGPARLPDPPRPPHRLRQPPAVHGAPGAGARARRRRRGQGRGAAARPRPLPAGEREPRPGRRRPPAAGDGRAHRRLPEATQQPRPPRQRRVPPADHRVRRCRRAGRARAAHPRRARPSGDDRRADPAHEREPGHQRVSGRWRRRRAPAACGGGRARADPPRPGQPPALLHARHGHPGAALDRGGERAAPRARARRAAALLPADGLRARRPRAHRGGAAALEQPGAGLGVAGGVHPGGRGERADRGDRRLGARDRLPPGPPLAGHRAAADPRGGKRLRTPARRRPPARARARGPRTQRHRPRPARDRAHRERDDERQRAQRTPGRGDQPHGRERLARRLRHRLLLARLPEPLRPHQAEDRPQLRRRPDARPEELDHRGCHPGPGARAGPARGRRGRGDGGAARAARRRRLRCAAGLPVQPAGGAGRPRRAHRPLRAGRALREAEGVRRQRLIGAPSPLSAAARSWPGAATTG